MRKLMLVLVVVVVGLSTSCLAAESTGKWKVEIKESALDRSKTAFLVLLPENGQPGVFGVRCNKKELMVTFSINEYMGKPVSGTFDSDNGPKIKFATDDGAVQEQDVAPTADGKAVYVTSKAADAMLFLERTVGKKTKESIASTAKVAKDAENMESGKFLRNLYGDKKLVIQLSPYQQAPQERIFDITGISEALSSVKDVCPHIPY